MTFSKILEIEDNNKDKIYLFLEGTFYKAYEHSAYFFHRYIKDFRLTRRFIKNVNRHVISLGFPSTSLNKWFYEYKVTPIDEKTLVCEIEHNFDETAYLEFEELARVQTDTADRYTVHTSVIEKAPVYKTAYDLLTHVLTIAKHIDKTLLDPLGHKAKNLAYDIAYGVRTLYDAEDRETHIDKIQSDCKELSFVLQTLCDMKQLARDSYALQSERIVSVSKQLQSLRKGVPA